MYCPNKDKVKKGFPKVLAIAFFIFFFGLNNTVYAEYLSISLSPDSGTIYGDSTTIQVLVDSGIDEFTGIDIPLQYTGGVEYITANGADRCDSFNLDDSVSGALTIECVSTSHQAGEAYKGVVATLYVKATQEGSSEFTFGTVSPTVTTSNGGTYTLTLETAPTETEELPEAGIFDNKTVATASIGFLVFSLGFFFNTVANSFNYLGDKVEEVKVSRRRSKIEKRFK
jgi:hypothetical protein